jgi:hypothetical protein
MEPLMTPRRVFAGLMLAGTAAAAAAQAWPDKASTRFIVPFPAGGVLDVLTRSVAEPLQADSGKTIVVENLPGAAGNIGIQQVARAAGDGAAVLFVPQGNITINATLLPNAPFNWERDFKPVTLLAYAPNVLVVHPSVPARTVAELIAHAKANPGKLAYASPGNGSSLHLIGELVKREAKIDLLHVPYKGTAAGFDRRPGAADVRRGANAAAGHQGGAGARARGRHRAARRSAARVADAGRGRRARHRRAVMVRRDGAGIDAAGTDRAHARRDGSRHRAARREGQACSAGSHGGGHRADTVCGADQARDGHLGGSDPRSQHQGRLTRAR